MGTANYSRQIGGKGVMLYRTWYDFKKDFEKQLGHGLFNPDWLEVKPKAPLPWSDADMKTALSSERIRRQQTNKEGARFPVMPGN